MTTPEHPQRAVRDRSIAGPAARLDELITSARHLITPGRRRMLGITGAPGAGKSTLAAAVVEALGESAVMVGMDGFHLRDDELRRLGRYERKGALDTFDVAGFVHLLRRLRRQEPLVYAPIFDRALEESIGSALPVAADVALIVVEGNYLLVGDGAWAEVASLLDECWYVEPGEDERLRRLIGRHVAFGRDPREAEVRATAGADGRNADVVAATRDRASRIVTF